MGACVSCLGHRPAWKEFTDHPILQNYKLGNMLGSGAFSEVWKATHLETQQVVALKIVFWGNPGVKAGHKKILMKEVQALTALKHENIVAMTEHLDDEKNLAMCLEFLDGGGLLERLNQVEHYSETEASILFRQMLAGVAYMHSQNFIHRDIKPENMVFTEPLKRAKANKIDTSLKLVDFGLAALHHPSHCVKSRLGSPGFMSPETIDFKRHGPAMDVFALGVILFIMLTGNKPMKTEQAAHLTYSTFEAHEYPHMTSHSWTRLSKPAQDLVLRMLEKTPAKRITAAQALEHEWVLTKGGTQPVPLTEVGKHATNLARQRKQFKGMANAIIAINRLGPSASERVCSQLRQEVLLEKEEVAQGESAPNAQDKGTCIHPEPGTCASADENSALVQALAGSLPVPSSQSSQGESPKLLSMDERCDSRSKSPIAAVEA